MRKVLITAMISALLGVNSMSMAQASKEVKEADEKMVENCEFLGTITEKAFIGTVKKARKMVFKEAKKIGASHVVFTESEGANVVSFASATGRAYRCN